MKKNTLKVITTIIMFIMMISIISSTVFARTVTPANVVAQDLKGNGVNEILTIGGTFVTVLQTVGVVLSVLILIVLGIKYMMGSAEEKAEYKKTMIPYIVGAAFIFGASTLANMIYGLVKM